MTAEQTKLCEDNLPLASWVAKKYRECGIKFDDLTQIARVGLVKAAKTFDTARSKFATYAVPVIKNEIFQALRQVRRRNAAGILSLDAPAIDGGSALLDLIPDGAESTEETFERRDMVVRGMACLSEKDASLLIRRFVLKEKQEDIAKRLGVTQSYVGRYIRSECKKIRGIIEET